MRKLLFVQSEYYLERALEDVGNLIQFEQQRMSGEDIFDLLAVILISPSTIALITSEQQTCDRLHLADSNPMFGPDSMSVNGMWLLLTVRQSELLEQTVRQVALSQILITLRTKGIIKNLADVFPVFSPKESESAIGEQMSYLGSIHPDLPKANALFWATKGSFATLESLQ
jgi:hypothetical protein